ncbi:hypothetical protein LZ645_11595 [Shewanella algae]|uniref:hypothetical protein n=1 Tax=Shewanella algae TaxID=38313 RepID=UPI001F2EBFAE|nr:hypothetical protein [Shewanella algae]MCE9775588.1 hypothetical protein [Shewanella algae]
MDPKQEQEKLAQQQQSEIQDQQDNRSDEELDAVSFFNEISAEDSKDSTGEEGSKGLDQEGGKTDKQAQSDAQDTSAATDQGQVAADEEDPWASVPEHVRSQFSQLQNDHRANAGRVSALTRKANELEAENRRLKESQQSGQAKGKGGEEQAPSAEQLSGMSMAEIEQEFPEIAALINAKLEQAVKPLTEQLTPLQEHRQRLEQRDHEDFIQSQYQQLAQAHPDYQQASADPRFGQWLSMQSPGVQQMANSDLASDNITLLNQFKADTGFGKATPEAQPQQPNGKGKNSLSDFAELDRKGASRASAEPDDVDPVAFFNQITSE